jgi:hypothetical protein
MDTAVGIASGYRLDDLGVGVQVLVKNKIFLLFTSSRPTSYPMGTGGFFLRGKAAEA